MKSKIIESIIIFILISRAFGGATQLWIEPDNTPQDKYYIGEIIPLRIRINTYGEKITGSTCYLTLDTRYVQIILQDNGRPFRTGTFFYPEPADENDLHHDELDNPMKNGIPGLQLDYFQKTRVAIGGVRPSKSGDGILAYFDVIVVGIPDNPDHEYTIKFDFKSIDTRETGYFLHGTPGQLQNFNNTVNFTFSIFGIKIDPPFKDIVVIPGTNYEKYLGDHFISNEFGKNLAIWDYEILEDVTGVVVQIDTVNNADMLTINAGANSHGKLKLKMDLSVSGKDYSSTQNWNIFIDHPPTFKDPLPRFNLLEDIGQPIDARYIFDDLDDPDENINFRMEGDSVINVTFENGFFYVSTKENWYGQTTPRFFLTDSLAPEIDTLILFNVTSVNDTPVVDFTGVSGDLLLLDTLEIFHMLGDTIPLNDFVSDVDDSVFTWATESNSNLDLNIINDESLIVTVSGAGQDYFGTIPIKITATDENNGTGSDVVMINVRSYPPKIADIKMILLHADSTKQLDMSNYVIDLDTDLSQLTWNFSAVDSATGIIDPNVNVSFNNGTNILTITSVSGHDAENYLIIDVEDDAENKDNRKVPLIVSSTYAPRISPFPNIIVFQDTIMDVIDLDNYVFDINNTAEDISWEFYGDQLFESVSINDTTHIVTIETSPNTIGVDTINFIATNKLALQDTAKMVVYCIPRDGKPVIYNLPDITMNWRETVEYINLDEFVFDVFTEDEMIIWNITNNSVLLDVNVDESRNVSITSYDNSGTTDLIFTATNKDGLFNTDTVTVIIHKDTAPVWQTIDNIYLVRTKPENKLNFALTDKCTDNETLPEDIVFTASYDQEVLSIVIDDDTKEVIVTIVDTTKSTTWVKFSAEDEHHNISETIIINVYIGEGLPPIWDRIPIITFNNSDIFDDLNLLDYCNDQDDNSNDLVFSAISSNNKIIVEIYDLSHVRITPVNSISGNNFYVIFKVEDTQGNIVSTSVKTIIADDLPPFGIVNHFLNPIIPQRVNFVVTTDPSVNTVESKFTRLPSTDITLNFLEFDSDDAKKLWKTDYKFTANGGYKLIVNMEDNGSNISHDTLVMTIEMAKKTGGLFKLANDNFTIKYPSNNFENQLFLISESENYFIKNGLSKSTTNENIFNKIFSIESEFLLNETLLTLRYSPTHRLNRYHSFYKIENNQKYPIETYINKNGEFISFINENMAVLFGKSDTPANNQRLPGEEFYCYPNPFNSTVKIKFMVKQRSRVELAIYNILGQKVLTRKQYFEPGIHDISWHGINSYGQNVPSGIYFILLKKNHENSKLKKVTLFK